MQVSRYLLMRSDPDMQCSIGYTVRIIGSAEPGQGVVLPGEKKLKKSKKTY